MCRTCALSILIISLLPLGCAGLGEDRADAARRVAEAQSRLVTTAEQARLWRTSSQNAANSGLEKVPIMDHPVTLRQRVVVENRVVQPQPFQFPKELLAGVRIIAAPELTERRFVGVVHVARVESELIELDLGERRSLSFYARAGGGALRTVAGERAQLDYRATDDPVDQRVILAFRTSGGDGIVSILETGRTPVSVEVPLFDLTATQLARAENDTADVEVRVGGERKILTQGQLEHFSASQLSVGLVASIAYTGASAARAEGNPYAIRLVAWPKR